MLDPDPTSQQILLIGSCAFHLLHFLKLHHTHQTRLSECTCKVNFVCPLGRAFSCRRKSCNSPQCAGGWKFCKREAFAVSLGWAFLLCSVFLTSSQFPPGLVFLSPSGSDACLSHSRVGFPPVSEVITKSGKRRRSIKQSTEVQEFIFVQKVV